MYCRGNPCGCPVPCPPSYVCPSTMSTSCDCPVPCSPPLCTCPLPNCPPLSLSTPWGSLSPRDSHACAFPITAATDPSITYESNASRVPGFTPSASSVLCSGKIRPPTTSQRTYTNCFPNKSVRGSFSSATNCGTSVEMGTVAAISSRRIDPKAFSSIKT